MPQKFFSGGLDITELYQPKIDRMKEFWRELQNLWMRLYVTPLATVAAINGHSPAGGCLLTMSCDYRAMTKGFTIGLNETQLGISAPFWFADTMKNVIGHRLTEKSLQLGTMYSSEDALKIGLVDEVWDTNEITLEHSIKQLTAFTSVNAFARHQSKIALRQSFVDKLKKNQDQDIESFVNAIVNEKIQKGLGLYLQSLKNKKK